MTVNWLEMRQPQQQQGHIRRLSEHELRLAQENARLTEENRRLRVVCDDLAASSELWIRLYEAALARESDRLQKQGNP